MLQDEQGLLSGSNSARLSLLLRAPAPLDREPRSRLCLRLQWAIKHPPVTQLPQPTADHALN